MSSLLNARSSERVTTSPRAIAVLVGAALIHGACHAPARAATTITSAEGPSSTIPTARSDSNSMLAHRQLLAKRTQGTIDLYFLGNSITRRWGATDYPQFLTHWREQFFGWNAANFGWGADRTENILWRLENGELDDVHPKVIVLLAGTNNVGNTPGAPNKVEEVTQGVVRIIETCRRKAPKATIIVTGIFPRNDNARDPLAVIPEITRINANLRRYVDGKRVRYIDVSARLADSTGRLLPGMMVDGLHPSVTGYQQWADVLRPVLTQLLGPRKSTDNAPPPTGDPSAAKR